MSQPKIREEIGEMPWRDEKSPHQGCYKDQEPPREYFQYRCMRCRTIIPLENITSPLDGICPKCNREVRYMKIGDLRPLPGIKGVLPDSPTPPPAKWQPPSMIHPIEEE